MEFGVLGPLMVRVKGEWVQLAGAKQRAILGMLLINANRIVPSDQLLEEVWGERQPTAGIRTLRYHVSKLRDSLDPDRLRGRGSPLKTESGGYLLRVEEGDLDAQRFERLAADGAKALAAQRFPEARSRLRDALGLWRGDAFDDFRYESFAQGEIARLEEERLVCLENRIAADLELGQHREVVAELRELTTRYPLQESLWAHLMVALYRTGEQAEAVHAYETARRVLGEQLGVEPNAALQRLEQQIRQHELPFQPPPAVETPRRGNLPARVDSLIGRDGEADTVRELVDATAW